METEELPGRSLAISAEVLYLANLMLAPGLAFLVLAVLWLRHRKRAPMLARNHLQQTFLVSLYGGVLIISVIAALLAFGVFGQVRDSGLIWVAVILYFTCIHSALILLGIAGLVRALAGQPFRYPLIGPRLLRY